MFYKVLGPNMEAFNGDGMIYELGKEYVYQGTNIECCVRGYHYFNNIKDCMKMYELINCRLFECDVLGYTCSNRFIMCTNKIKLVREVSQEVIKEYIKENLEYILKSDDGHFATDRKVKENLINYRIGLEKMINDDDWYIRSKLASMGYGLDTLINDKSFYVRQSAKRKLEELNK